MIKPELDKQVEALIKRNTGNAYEINQLVFESAMVLTSASKRATKKASQGFLTRFGKNITGKNNQTQNDINKELSQAQYAAQKILVKLAEQQQLSFELISLVQNKLNAEVSEINGEINDIYKIQNGTHDRIVGLQQRIDEMQGTLDKICGQLSDIDERLATLEERQKLSDWSRGIKFQTYKGVEYINLNETQKIVCVVRDFFDFMQRRKGTKTDLILLKTAMSELGLKVTLREGFIQSVGRNSELYEHLLGKDSRLEEFVTEREKIIFDMQQSRGNYSEEDRKLLPLIETNVQNVVFELLFNLKQITLSKEIHDEAERLFVGGNISEALPILTKIVELGNVKVRYMLAVIFHEGIGVEKNSAYVENLLAANISAGDICSVFFGKRVGVYKEDIKRNFEPLKRLADSGNIFAGYELYQYKNTPEYLEFAANQNYFLAAHEFGLLNYMGQGGVPKNNELALKYFEIAAKYEQYKEPLFYLGHIYWHGHCVDVNKKKAVEYYKKAYELGTSSDESINRIILFYEVEKNFYERVKWCRIGAEKNYPTCLSNLGLAYQYGNGVDKNYSEAVKYFEKAIAAGSNSGYPEIHLGDIYHKGGNGITQDYEKSADWYAKAIDKDRDLSDETRQNMAEAEYQTGCKYRYGLYGTQQADTKAVNWYMKSYFHGKDCVGEIADCYEKLQKHKKALKFYLLGVEKNSRYCAWKVGSYYRYGNGGLNKDYEKALEYYALAIQFGETDGYCEKWIADILWDGGYGVAADRDAAINFYWLGANKGCTSAQDWLIETGRAGIMDRISWAL